MKKHFKFSLFIICAVLLANLMFSFNTMAQTTPASTGGTDPAVAGGTDPKPVNDLYTTGKKIDLLNPLTGKAELKTLPEILNGIIVALLGLTGVLSLVAFIYSGVLWMISFGDPMKVEKGKKMMIWAVIGLLVVFGSYAFLTLLFRAFGVAATG